MCSWEQAQGFLGRPGRGWGVRAGHVARLGRAIRRPRPPAGATLAPTGRPALPSPAQDSQQRHAGLGWNHWGTAVGVRHPNATVVGRCQTPLATVPPTRAISAGGSDTCGNLTCMPHRCQTPHAHRFFKHDRAPGVSDTCQLSTRYPKSTDPRSCEPRPHRHARAPQELNYPPTPRALPSHHSRGGYGDACSNLARCTQFNASSRVAWAVFLGVAGKSWKSVLCMASPTQ